MSYAVQNPHADSEVSGISKHSLILFSFLPPFPSASALMNSPYWSHRVACHTTLGTDYLSRAQPAKKHFTLLEGRLPLNCRPSNHGGHHTYISVCIDRQTGLTINTTSCLPCTYGTHARPVGCNPGESIID